MGFVVHPPDEAGWRGEGGLIHPLFLCLRLAHSPPTQQIQRHLLQTGQFCANPYSRPELSRGKCARPEAGQGGGLLCAGSQSLSISHSQHPAAFVSHPLGRTGPIRCAVSPAWRGKCPTAMQFGRLPKGEAGGLPDGGRSKASFLLVPQRPRCGPPEHRRPRLSRAR